jgi:hypothetical protein
MFLKRFYSNIPKINRKYKYYCDPTYNSCHCINYGESCKYVYNKITNENFEKYLLYINNKSLEKTKSKKNYEKLLKDWT